MEEKLNPTLELREKKEKLENDIALLIRDFVDDVGGCEIEFNPIIRFYYHDEQDKPHYTVNVRSKVTFC